MTSSNRRGGESHWKKSRDYRLIMKFVGALDSVSSIIEQRWKLLLTLSFLISVATIYGYTRRLEADWITERLLGEPSVVLWLAVLVLIFVAAKILIFLLPLFAESFLRYAFINRTDIKPVHFDRETRLHMHLMYIFLAVAVFALLALTVFLNWIFDEKISISFYWAIVPLVAAFVLAALARYLFSSREKTKPGNGSFLRIWSRLRRREKLQFRVLVSILIARGLASLTFFLVIVLLIQTASEVFGDAWNGWAVFLAALGTSLAFALFYGLAGHISYAAVAVPIVVLAVVPLSVTPQGYLLSKAVKNANAGNRYILARCLSDNCRQRFGEETQVLFHALTVQDEMAIGCREDLSRGAWLAHRELIVIKVYLDERAAESQPKAEDSGLQCRSFIVTGGSSG